MDLGGTVKHLYAKAAGFVKKEQSFVKASMLASAACALDALSTKIVFHEHPIYRLIEKNNFTEYLVNHLGLTAGLTLETAITLGIALPLAYSLNKIMREEWRPSDYLSRNIALPGSIAKKNILPKILKRDYGTTFLYLLSATSIWGAYSNTEIYYMLLGISK